MSESEFPAMKNPRYVLYDFDTDQLLPTSAGVDHE